MNWTFLAFAVSHIVCFALGAVTWNVIARREVSELTHEPDPGSPIHRPHLDPETPKSLPRIVTVILIASGLLIAIGIQQFIYQGDKNEEFDKQEQSNACLEAWGQELTETVSLRAEATKDLRKAEEKRDNALDRIILLVIALRAQPPEATVTEFNEALANFAAKKEALTLVQEQVRSTSEDNPYPLLDC